MKPGDKVTILFAEVMYDLKRDISGHNPDIIRFIYKKKQIFEDWGYNVQILRAETDYLDNFWHKLTRSPDPDRVGKTWGFVPSRICAIKRECKLKPINAWVRDHANENTLRYIGIAIDEPSRLTALHKETDNISLLERYGYTEADAMALCEANDMLSPQYNMPGLKRDGCWFCPNAKLCEHKAIYKEMPEIWKEYVELEKTPDLAYPKWNTYSDQTLAERDILVRQDVL